MGMYSDMENSRINDVDVFTEEETKQKNRELCERFPFLIPRNRFSGKKITDCCGPNGEEGYWPGSPEEHPEYDFEYTELDDMPDGWRIAFGEDMMQEIMDDLVANDCVDDFWITQIKEKYAVLRFYCMGATDRIINVIIPKYEDISRRTCIGCGKPATVVSTGWFCPWCDECAGGILGSYVPIDEFYEPYEGVRHD